MRNELSCNIQLSIGNQIAIFQHKAFALYIFTLHFYLFLSKNCLLDPVKSE